MGIWSLVGLFLFIATEEVVAVALLLEGDGDGDNIGGGEVGSSLGGGGLSAVRGLWIRSLKGEEGEEAIVSGEDASEEEVLQKRDVETLEGEKAGELVATATTEQDILGCLSLPTLIFLFSSFCQSILLLLLYTSTSKF